jgi:general secretion pathway protein C
MKTYLVLINLLLLTGASYLGVSSFYQVIGSKIEVINPSADAGETQAVPEKEPIRALSEYKAIEDRNLFRLKQKQEIVPEPAKVDINALKETKLQLKLWGTVTGDDQNAYAVIEDTKQRVQQLYHIEDAVQNAIVKEIHREKVILEVNGAFEVLQMEESQETAGGSNVARRVSGEKRENVVNPSESRRISLKRDRIDEAVNDLGNLMKQVRIRPHYKNGQSDGLTLSGIRSDSIFSEMGFRNGDVIIGVDGKNIQSVDDALSLYQNLQSGESVQVQIRRRGRLQTIDYAVE